MLSAGTIADAVQLSLTNAVRHGRVDLAAVCCTADSQLAGEVIIKAGTALGVDYAETLSCYDPTPDGRHCGSCDACHLRRKGFRDAGMDDPTPYAA